MSIINKMLQELDRRNGRAASPGQVTHPEVRAVHAQGGQEWFWRVIAGLMLIAALWTLWVVYQLQPRSVVTELAYRAAENSRRQVAEVRQSAATLREVASPTVATGIAAKPAPERLAVPLETLRLALTIDTPLAPRKPRQETGKTSRPEPRPSPVRPKPQAVVSTTAPVLIEKRAREVAPVDDAERLFRQAAVLLERGRVAEAEANLRAALTADHTHQPARQTLIALDIEQGKIEDARRRLQEGLALNPSHAPYAVALARIYVDRGEFTPALEVLDAVGTADRGSADYHAMHGAVLLRMARYDDAANAYRRALGSGAQAGSSWVGLGVALEALGSNAEAAEAFRRGVATGTLSSELQAYAEQRSAQLR